MRFPQRSTALIFSESHTGGIERDSQLTMAIAALARPWRGILKQDFVEKTTQKSKRAPFCVLIDIVGRHKQQHMPLLRSIEGSAIASQY